MIYDSKSNAVHYNVWNQEYLDQLLLLLKTFEVKYLIIQCSEEYTTPGTFYDPIFKEINDYCNENNIDVTFYTGAYDIPYATVDGKVIPSGFRVISLYRYFFTKYYPIFINQKVPTVEQDKYFYSLSNMPHLHRCMFIDYLHKYKLQDKSGFTWNRLQDEEYSHTDKYRFKYWEEKKVVDNKYKNRGAETIPPVDYFKSVFEVVLESSSEINFITEKTCRTITYGRPFILVGRKELHNHLRDLGFMLFDNIIDYSFDEIEDLETRIDAICKELQRITQTYTIEELKELTATATKFNKEHILELSQQASTEYRQVVDKFPDIKYYLYAKEREVAYRNNTLISSHNYLF